MYTYLTVLPILSAILCVGLGLFTFTRNPRHPVNIGFMLGMLSLTLIEVGNAIVLYSGEYGLTQTGVRLTIAGQALLPPAWLLFTVVFARSNYRQILLKWTPLLLLISAAAIVFIFFSGSEHFTGTTVTGATSLGYIGRYFYIYLLLGLILNLIQIENTLRSSRGSKRQKIKNITIGVGAILAFLLYTSSQTLLFGVINTRAFSIIAAVILISTSLMTLSIIKYRLMNTDIYVSRYVVYNSLTLLLVGLYLIIVGIVVHGIRYFNVPFDYFFITLFVFISILTLSFIFFSAKLRRKVKIFITRHFYRQKYAFREKWTEATEKISSRRKTDEVLRALEKMISETMEPKSIYLWVCDPVSREYHGQNNVPEKYRNLTVKEGIVEESTKLLVPFMVDIDDNGTDTPPAQPDNIYSATGAVLCAPIVTDKDLIGLVLIGEDLTGEPYSEDDFGFLKVLTTQAAVQLKNIMLTNDLMDVKEVEAFHNMSSFIMHDLKNLTNSLSLISQNAKANINNPEFQKDAIRSIDGTVVRMKNLIGKLSDLPTDINLRKRPACIKLIIDHAIKLLPVNDSKGITVLNNVEERLQVNIDQDAILMVFLNLLKNAYEAIGENGAIKITSKLNGQNAEVSVSDNGAGMSNEYIRTELFRPFKTSKKSGFGIGLFQCKAIIDAHGGKIGVRSEVGNGSTFNIILPEAATDKLL